MGISNELTAELDNRPAVPDAATLDEITEHITDVITHGDLHQQKTLVEALVAEVKITAPDRIIPVFRIPNRTKSTAERGPNSPKPD